MVDDDEVPRGDRHRLFVRGLESYGPVTVDGLEYAGTELALLVRMDPSQIEAEVARTPQLVFELGRAMAAASRARRVIDAEYRHWRDSKILAVTTDPEAARAEGLSEGSKVVAKTVAEVWVRTLEEYVSWHDRQARAEEAYNTLIAAWEAAKLRKDAAYALRSTEPFEASPESTGPGQYPAPGNHYDVPHRDLNELTAAVLAAERTPYPPGPVPPPGPPPFPKTHP